MKKILYLFLLAGIAALYGNDSQLMKDTNELIDTLIEDNLEGYTIPEYIPSPEEIIHKLQIEIHKLKLDIVRLKSDLAKMRVNQSGKGAIKPQLQHAAKAITKNIQEKNNKIFLKESQIQILTAQINRAKKQTVQIQNLHKTNTMPKKK